MAQQLVDDERRAGIDAGLVSAVEAIDHFQIVQQDRRGECLLRLYGFQNALSGLATFFGVVTV